MRQEFWKAALRLDCPSPYQVLGQVRSEYVGLVVLDGVEPAHLKSEYLMRRFGNHLVEQVQKLGIRFLFRGDLVNFGWEDHDWDGHPTGDVHFGYFAFSGSVCTPARSGCLMIDANLQDGQVHGASGLLADFTVPTAERLFESYCHSPRPHPHREDGFLTANGLLQTV